MNTDNNSNGSMIASAVSYFNHEIDSAVSTASTVSDCNHENALQDQFYYDGSLPPPSAPIPFQQMPPYSPGPSMSPYQQEQPIPPLPSPLTSLLIPLGLTLQDSILSLPLVDAPKLICCGKSIKHFPSKYIHRVRNLYTKHWSAVVETPHDIFLWQKAILLTMVLTVRGQHPGLGPFLDKIALLETDQWDKVTFSLFVTSAPTEEFKATLESKNKRVNVLAKAGELSRALGTLLSDSAPTAVTPAVLQSLEGKHPPRPSVIPDTLAPSDAFKASQELFDITPIAAYSLIQKSSREIAPGVDNLRYEHLKQLAGRNSSPAEMEFIRIIADVLTRFANADIPPQVALYYASPQLIPLVRRSQPCKVRPIVLGPVLLALASRHVLLSDSVKKRVQQMSTLQLGVGVPNGIEKVIHTVQLGMQFHPNLNFLKTDLSNAFNALDREKLLTSCREFAPQIYPMVHALYGPVGQLSVVGESCVYTIESAMGAQQGDVKGPFLFVNAIHQHFVEGLANILRPHQGAFVQFIIDDGNFLLPDEAVLEVLTFTMRHGPSLGIHINASKTELLMGKHGSYDAANSFFEQLTDPLGPYQLDPSRVKFHPDDYPNDAHLYGTRVLGTPIGYKSFVEIYLKNLITELATQGDRLAKYAEDEPQIGFLLLHHCFSKKVNHLLRTLPPAVSQEQIIVPFNDVLKRVVLAIFNTSGLDSITWQQINLRIDSGGLGIGIDASTSYAAFAASFLSAVKTASEIYPLLHGDIVDGGSIPYVQDFCRSVCIINLNDYDTPPAFLTLLDQASGSGKSRMEKLQQRLLQGHHASKDSEFVAAITPTLSSLARYHSAASSEASAALLAVPKTQQLSFPKQAYRVFLRRRFGMAIPQIALRRCVCKSKPELDRLGTHLVCMCPKGRERFITHDSMAICIRDMAKAAGAYAKFENPDQFRAVDTDNGTRPDLLFVGIQEQRILGDVLITEPCCKTLTRQQANTQGWAAKRGEDSKVTKYGGPASQGGHVFLPFVFETYGLWGKGFQDFFTATMRQAEEYRGVPRAAISTYWRRRISVTLHKTMAEGILARAGRLNSGPFRDESSWEGVMESQSYQR